MQQPAIQRAAPLVHLSGLLHEFGVPLTDVLAGSGLTAEDIAPGRFVPFNALLTALETSARLTKREDFGLLLGARHTIQVLGPLATLMRTAATLGEALSDFAAFQRTNSSGATVYLHRQKDQVFLGYGLFDPRLQASPIALDLVLAAGLQILHDLTEGAVRPLELMSMRPAPRQSARWSALGAPIGFGQAETGLYLSPAHMAFPLVTADRHARAAALRMLWSEPALARNEWTLRTRHTLRSLLLEGRSRMPQVARELDMQPRTLRRALAKEDTTFEAARDSVRLAIAQDLLSMTGLSIGDLAVTLDFATPSAFVHAFRRWTGMTPGAWREAHRRAGKTDPRDMRSEDKPPKGTLVSAGP